MEDFVKVDPPSNSSPESTEEEKDAFGAFSDDFEIPEKKDHPAVQEKGNDEFGDFGDFGGFVEPPPIEDNFGAQPLSDLEPPSDAFASASSFSSLPPSHLSSFSDIKEPAGEGFSDFTQSQEAGDDFDAFASAPVQQTEEFGSLGDGSGAPQAFEEADEQQAGGEQSQQLNNAFSASTQADSTGDFEPAFETFEVTDQLGASESSPSIPHSTQASETEGAPTFADAGGDFGTIEDPSFSSPQDLQNVPEQAQIFPDDSTLGGDQQPPESDFGTFEAVPLEAPEAQNPSAPEPPTQFGVEEAEPAADPSPTHPVPPIEDDGFGGFPSEPPAEDFGSFGSGPLPPIDDFGGFTSQAPDDFGSFGAALPTEEPASFLPQEGGGFEAFAAQPPSEFGSDAPAEAPAPAFDDPSPAGQGTDLAAEPILAPSNELEGFAQPAAADDFGSFGAAPLPPVDQDPSPSAGFDAFGAFGSAPDGAQPPPADEAPLPSTGFDDFGDFDAAPVAASPSAFPAFSGFGDFTTTQEEGGGFGGEFGGEEGAQMTADFGAGPAQAQAPPSVGGNFDDFGGSDASPAADAGPGGLDALGGFPQDGAAATSFGAFGAPPAQDAGGFGDFGAPAPLAASAGEGDFGGFGDFGSQQGGDDFGDFGASQGQDGFGGFADFGASVPAIAPPPQQASQSKGGDDFGDFGDFGPASQGDDGFESQPAPTFDTFPAAPSGPVTLFSTGVLSKDKNSIRAELGGILTPLFDSGEIENRLHVDTNASIKALLTSGASWGLYSQVQSYQLSWNQGGIHTTLLDMFGVKNDEKLKPASSSFQSTPLPGSSTFSTAKAEDEHFRASHDIKDPKSGAFEEPKQQQYFVDTGFGEVEVAPSREPFNAFDAFETDFGIIPETPATAAPEKPSNHGLDLFSFDIPTSSTPTPAASSTPFFSDFSFDPNTSALNDDFFAQPLPVASSAPSTTIPASTPISTPPAFSFDMDFFSAPPTPSVTTSSTLPPSSFSAPTPSSSSTTSSSHPAISSADPFDFSSAPPAFESSSANANDFSGFGDLSAITGGPSFDSPLLKGLDSIGDPSKRLICSLPLLDFIRSSSLVLPSKAQQDLFVFE